MLRNNNCLDRKKKSLFFVANQSFNSKGFQIFSSSKHFIIDPFMTEAVNQWTGFYMITASVMKELNKFPKDHNLMKNQRQRYEASLMKVLNPLIKHFRTKWKKSKKTALISPLEWLLLAVWPKVKSVWNSEIEILLTLLSITLLIF